MSGATSALLGSTSLSPSGSPAALAWGAMYGTDSATSNTQAFSGFTGALSISASLSGGGTLYYSLNGAYTTYTGGFVVHAADALSWSITAGHRDASGNLTVTDVTHSTTLATVAYSVATSLERERVSMIRVERDPAWWTAIAEHPAVEGWMLGMPPTLVGQLCLRTDVLPLAAEHGGFYFARTDHLGFVCEIHALMTPEGWGRPALVAMNEAVNAVWICGYQVITASEVHGNPRSRPPKAFGFVQAGDWRETPIGRLRMWILTRQAWNGSPAMRRGLVN